MSHVVKEIKHLMGKALHSRDMIRDGDHVLVAVSGGKDSISLLGLLRDRLARVPIKYTITAVHVDPGFGANSADRMEEFFSSQGFQSRVVRGDFGPLAHSPENRENPCFLCSRIRRKILFETARDLGCNRIAFGHHKDDVIETFFLNIFYGASVSTMKPVQEFFGGKLFVIRPFFMVDSDLIHRYFRLMGWQEVNLGCPTAGASKREEIKTLLKQIYRGNKKVRGNIFHALQNVKPEYLL